MTTTTNIDALAAEIEALENEELLVASNSGTFGAAEASRKVGTGDPASGTRYVYHRVGGGHRVEGPDIEDMPGRMIDFPNAKRELAQKQKRLGKLREQYRMATHPALLAKAMGKPVHHIKVVGQTPSGDPIMSVPSSRLVRLDGFALGSWRDRRGGTREGWVVR